MTRFTKTVLIAIGIFAFLGAVFGVAHADKLEDLKNQIDQYASELGRLGKQSDTLKNQIAQFNAQISLTELRIAETEEKINLLGGRIDSLEVSLESLTDAFSSRAVETYKMARLGDPLVFLITSDDLNEAVSRYNYLLRIQDADRDLLVRLQKAQDIYKEQKTGQEILQEELGEQRENLTTQKISKNNLLQTTKNDEKRYQQLLTQAQEEIKALANSQFSGKKDVKKGDIIGLMGSTGFSSGPHLHFGYYNIREEEAEGLFGGTDWYFARHVSPAEALQARTLLHEDYSCDDVTVDQNKSIGNGPLPWPMSNPRITQCYGHTPYSNFYSDNTHKGFDMSDKNDTTIRAVEDGVAYFYRGTGSFGNNARVFHANGKMSLYMHMQ